MNHDHPQQRHRFRRPAILLGCAMILSTHAVNVQAEDVLRRLTDGQLTAIYGSSAAVLIAGELAVEWHDDKPIDAVYVPNSVDRFMRRIFHGETDTLSNFLDSELGGALTPVAGLIGIAAIDIDRKEFARDVSFYISGLAATKGITAMTKVLVSRPRPYCVGGGCPPPERTGDDPYHHHSFISGHTSGAFFGATFFNTRFRRYMRRNWTEDEYEAGRWVSPIVSFGWASFVGLSRIHADKHYFTDVVAGALVGAALAELYHHLAYESVPDTRAGAPAVQFMWRWNL